MYSFALQQIYYLQNLSYYDGFSGLASGVDRIIVELFQRRCRQYNSDAGSVVLLGTCPCVKSINS